MLRILLLPAAARASPRRGQSTTGLGRKKFAIPRRNRRDREEGNTASDRSSAVLSEGYDGPVTQKNFRAFGWL